MDKIRILILAANPWDTKRLSLDEEFQGIRKLQKRSTLRKQFDVRYEPATRAEDILAELLEFKPHLLHFSGHGENSGLVFADVTGNKPYEVSKDALAQLFKLCAPELQGVFLNACHSAKQADAIVEQVDYVVGMNAAINDLAAISFSQGFYTAIFSQTQLNIEQAFEAGLAYMGIMNVDRAEQKKPLLLKHPNTYVPDCQHDVFISFADEDTQWTQDLSEYLRKQLKQQVATADGFQLYSGNDFSQLPQSALLLVIASPEYCQHYAAQFEKIGSFAKQQPVFLVELEFMPRPEAFKGLTSYRFWHNDDNDCMIPITGDAYVSKANDLATSIAKRLINLKEDKQQQQNLTQEQRVQQEKWVQKNIRRTINTTYAKALTWVKKQQTSAPSVFISYAWGIKPHMLWVKELAMEMEEAGIKVILDDWENSSLGGSVARFISKISTCDFVVVVGTPEYLNKFENEVSGKSCVVAAEVDLIAQRLLAKEPYKSTVIPLLLEGEEHTALPPLLRGRIYGDFRDARSYIPTLFDLILTLYKMNHYDSSVREYRERLRSGQQESHKQENIKSIDAVVFIHSAPEDLKLITEITPILENHGIGYFSPMERKSDTQPADIRQDIENHISTCDAVLILYEQTTPIWVREQLSVCSRLRRKRETPLKIIAVHKGKDQPDIGCQLKNLQVYICPPENIASYLQHFIKALA